MGECKQLQVCPSGQGLRITMGSDSPSETHLRMAVTPTWHQGWHRGWPSQGGPAPHPSLRSSLLPLQVLAVPKPPGLCHKFPLFSLLSADVTWHFCFQILPCDENEILKRSVKLNVASSQGSPGMLLKVHYSFSSLIHSEMPFVDPATCSGLEQHRITSSLPQGVRDPRHLLPLGHTPGCPLLSSLGPWSGTQGLPKMFLGFHLQKGRAQHQSLWELNFGIVSIV